MIYEIPKYKTTIDLSKVTAISWKEHVSAKKVPLWKFLLNMGWDRSVPEQKPHIRINPNRYYIVHYEYNTDKETKKVYDDLVKAWKGE